ncbi:toxin RelE [Gardnerella vaginalis]|uniref:Addiction module toxin RelE n=2 Tax=Gardnerella vaginalis TaxID=2702 RepID=A0A2I1PPC3_GARVA|nr:hypothetical protein HMPREF0421_21053 [Gardnerella vaginalis ATCC 14019]EIK74811.1 hypothetical protein CGSMWGv75712_03000 [Gardnerella vaginalis 75712]EPI54726.1 toxin-antitoxin system, toxin component, RelE domain protein [Gardnerella vaginalis JCP7276]KMT47125.1 toxin RelE [Gardnerella vaginalis]TCH82393.1 addiction module toxin RelE [Gardnerella vaginalis ATCC 14018 = JCM 11026]
MMFFKSLNDDWQPWGNLGFRKIRVKNYYIYFLVDENRKEIQILAVIYVRSY